MPLTNDISAVAPRLVELADGRRIALSRAEWTSGARGRSRTSGELQTG